MPRHPSLRTELSLFAQGYGTIIGLDEVGRGAWAGPLVGGAVLVTPQRIARCRRLQPIVRDSKLLTRRQREHAFAAIVSELRWAVGVVSHQELDAIGMGQANQLALQRALAALKVPPQFLLIDGRGFRFRQPCRQVSHGDAKVFCIAAAAIVAKVTRDRLMASYHRRYPRYGFAQHSGYGTPGHQAALAQHGPCPLHRTSFAPIAALLTTSGRTAARAAALRSRGHDAPAPPAGDYPPAPASAAATSASAGGGKLVD